MWNERPRCRKEAQAIARLDIPASPEAIAPAWLSAFVLSSSTAKGTGPLCTHLRSRVGTFDMQDVTVIEADLTDAQHQTAIVYLVNAYARDPMGDGQDLPGAVRNRLISGLRQHPTSLVFLAFDDTTPVGIAVCFVGFSTFAARSLINIHDLAVIPEYRGQGVGRALLERVEARGRELGCCKLTLEVREDNHRAHRLYQRFGFGDRPGEYGTVRNWFLQKRL
jgi:ribosomal protein S18 acetylase RimI-like enzyme